MKRSKASQTLSHSSWLSESHAELETAQNFLFLKGRQKGATILRFEGSTGLRGVIPRSNFSLAIKAVRCGFGASVPSSRVWLSRAWDALTRPDPQFCEV